LLLQQETLIKKLTADMDKMRNTYEGKQVLYNEGGVSKEEFETIRTDLIGREAAYRMAHKDLEILSIGFRDEDLKSKNLEIPADPAAKKKLLIDMNTAIPRAEVAVAASKVRSAEAQMKTTEALLRESAITSPVTGMVATRNKSVGEQVTGGSVSTAAQAIMVVVDIDPVYAVMSVKESDVKDLEKGMEMTFTADVYEKQTFNGKVEIITPVVDPKTHTLEVKALVRNPGYKLRPGMFIRASIASGLEKEMILLPSTAVVPGEGQDASVFLIRQDTCYRQPVKIGRQIDNMVEISSGINPGDIVAGDNLTQLREGMKVRGIKDEEKKPE
jgi:RND family efflux transporter MFP subunit